MVEIPKLDENSDGITVGSSEEESESVEFVDGSAGVVVDGSVVVSFGGIVIESFHFMN